MNVRQIVEAVLFASDAPLTASDIARSDESLDEDQVEEAIQLLRAEYDESGRAFQIVELAEGHQILTRPEFAPYLERFDNVPRPSRLSAPALETLAIIAYRQPIGRLEIEYIRGVTAAGVIRTLQERNLIEVVGRAEGLGRPLLYGTTRHFLEHFGFRSLEDLPRPEDLPVILRERTPLGLEDETSAEEVASDEAPADDAAQVDAAAGEAPDDASDVSAETRSADDAAEVEAPAAAAPASETAPDDASDVSAEARAAGEIETDGEGPDAPEAEAPGPARDLLQGAREP